MKSGEKSITQNTKASFPPVDDAKRLSELGKSDLTLRSHYKKGSMLDEDSTEVFGTRATSDHNPTSPTKKSKPSFPAQIHRSPAVNKQSKSNGSSPREQRIKKPRQRSAVEIMYGNLKLISNIHRREPFPFEQNQGQDEGLAIAINVNGSEEGKFGATAPQRATNFPDTRQQPQLAGNQTVQEIGQRSTAVPSPAAASFVIASGNFIRDGCSIDYSISEIMGSCFSLSLLVLATGQTWIVFVPSSETSQQLLRIWQRQGAVAKIELLCTWLIESTQLQLIEIDDDNGNSSITTNNNENNNSSSSHSNGKIIASTNFNSEQFERKCRETILDMFEKAALKLETQHRRFLAVKRVKSMKEKRKKLEQQRRNALQRSREVAATMQLSPTHTPRRHGNMTYAGRKNSEFSRGVGTLYGAEEEEEGEGEGRGEDTEKWIEGREEMRQQQGLGSKTLPPGFGGSVPGAASVIDGGQLVEGDGEEHDVYATSPHSARFAHARSYGGGGARGGLESRRLSGNPQAEDSHNSLRLNSERGDDVSPSPSSPSTSPHHPGAKKGRAPATVPAATTPAAAAPAPLKKTQSSRPRRLSFNSSHNPYTAAATAAGSGGGGVATADSRKGSTLSVFSGGGGERAGIGNRKGSAYAGGGGIGASIGGAGMASMAKEDRVRVHMLEREVGIMRNDVDEALLAVQTELEHIQEQMEEIQLAKFYGRPKNKLAFGVNGGHAEISDSDGGENTTGGGGAVSGQDLTLLQRNIRNFESSLAGMQATIDSIRTKQAESESRNPVVGSWTERLHSEVESAVGAALDSKEKDSLTASALMQLLEHLSAEEKAALRKALGIERVYDLSNQSQQHEQEQHEEVEKGGENTKEEQQQQSEQQQQQVKEETMSNLRESIRKQEAELAGMKREIAVLIAQAISNKASSTSSASSRPPSRARPKSVGAGRSDSSSGIKSAEGSSEDGGRKGGRGVSVEVSAREGSNSAEKTKGVNLRVSGGEKAEAIAAAELVAKISTTAVRFVTHSRSLSQSFSTTAAAAAEDPISAAVETTTRSSRVDSLPANTNTNINMNMNAETFYDSGSEQAFPAKKHGSAVNNAASSSTNKDKSERRSTIWQRVAANRKGNNSSSSTKSPAEQEKLIMTVNNNAARMGAEPGARVGAMRDRKRETEEEEGDVDDDSFPSPSSISMMSHSVSPLRAAPLATSPAGTDDSALVSPLSPMISPIRVLDDPQSNEGNHHPSGHSSRSAAGGGGNERQKHRQDREGKGEIVWVRDGDGLEGVSLDGGSEFDSVVAEEIREEVQQEAASILQRFGRGSVVRARVMKERMQNRIQAVMEIVASTKDAAVIDDALSTAVEANSSALAAKTLTRAVNLLAKYEKNGVLFPLNTTLLLNAVSFLHKQDLQVTTKGLDALNIVLKLTANVLDPDIESMSDLFEHAMHSYVENTAVIMRVAKCLFRLCDASEKNRRALSDRRLCAKYNQVLEVHLKNWTVVDAMVKCIVMLTVDSASSQTAIGDAGLCEALFQCFIEYIQDPKMCSLICKAITNLCAGNHRENQLRFISAGNTSYFGASAGESRRGSSSGIAGVQRSMITQIDQDLPDISSIGVAPGVYFKAILLHKENLRVLNLLITTVASIAASNEHTRSHFEVAGMISLLLSILQMYDRFNTSGSSSSVEEGREGGGEGGVFDALQITQRSPTSPPARSPSGKGSRSRSPLQHTAGTASSATISLPLSTDSVVLNILWALSHVARPATSKLVESSSSIGSGSGGGSSASNVYTPSQIAVYDALKRYERYGNTRRSASPVKEGAETRKGESETNGFDADIRAQAKASITRLYLPDVAPVAPAMGTQRIARPTVLGAKLHCCPRTAVTGGAAGTVDSTVGVHPRSGLQDVFSRQNSSRAGSRSANGSAGSVSSVAPSRMNSGADSVFGSR